MNTRHQPFLNGWARRKTRLLCEDGPTSKTFDRRCINVIQMFCAWMVHVFGFLYYHEFSCVLDMCWCGRPIFEIGVWIDVDRHEYS